MAYVAPNWVNGQAPALDAETLNAICQALEKLPMENGGTFATSGAAGLYNLINAAATLTSSTLASGDYVGIKDVSAGTGKQVTLSNLASWIGSNGTGAKIATGSYTGTGTYGSANPNSITFPFTPKLVWLYGMKVNSTGKFFGYNLYQNTTVNIFTVPFSALSTSYVALETPKYVANYDLDSVKSSNTFSKKSSSGTSMYWYNDYAAGVQFNTSTTTYYWIAFG